MGKVTKRYAVLKGDIIDSSRLSVPDQRSLKQRLREGAKRFAETFPRSVFGQLDVFSGDSWQLLMPEWRRSLRAAIYMRAVAKSVETLKADTRIAIGWGSVDEESLMPGRITESTGDAFTRSGHRLENMAKHERLAFDGDVEESAPFVRASLALADEIADRWKAKQAQAIAMALLGQKQEEIAAATGKKQPTVYKALKSAGWRGVEKFLEEIEYSLKRL